MWRGPMLHKALEQFLGDVHWGELDYLLIDMPPGTGDVAIGLAQLLPRAETVLVTTPQPAAQRVAERAAAVATRLEQRIVGVIENMSYHLCPCCGARDELFGSGGGALLAEHVDAPLLGQVPLEPALRTGSDNGVPVVEGAPGSAAAQAIGQIAERIHASRVQDPVARIRRPLTVL
jgi:ATP-binding protein involved in chromosome partitioning